MSKATQFKGLLVRLHEALASALDGGAVTPAESARAANDAAFADLRKKLAAWMGVDLEKVNALTRRDLWRIQQLARNYPEQLGTTSQWARVRIGNARDKEEGFEAGEPVFTFSPQFNKRQFLDALTAPYHKAQILWIEPIEGLRFEIVIEAARKMSDPLGHHEWDGEVRDYPSWCVEGRILRSTDPDQDEEGRMRMYLSVSSDGTFSGFSFQRVPSRPNPEAPVCLISGQYYRRNDLN
ncbi:hypothetical protein ACFRMN_19615 [Streptomyces sp. NPDC056835]|uniref:hypothetical protein n=1 Tax=Streptomyces sp. NPDC056835 TaxID=3345956 RepID=UPI003675D21A